jgi:hypothetical protein
MKRTFIYLFVLELTGITACAQQEAKQARVVELTLHPSKAPEPTQSYQLLPKTEDQNDADAAPLYVKAAQLLPKDFPSDQISKWRGMPLDKLPMAEVNKMLQAFKPSLQIVEQAAKCRQSNWPEVSTNLPEYRRLAHALALQASLLTAQGQYEQAVGTMGSGLAMARHIAESPSPIQGLVGIAIAAVICQQVEKTVQAPGAPNLYRALKDLPKPFIDLTKQIEFEDEDTKGKIRLIMNRLDRHVAILTCVEAIRLYAGTHEGKLPEKLSDITEVAIPDDPVTKRPFIYRLTGSKATLEANAPEGGTDKDAFKYELSLGKLQQKNDS